jgi:MbtH protein
MQVTDVTDEDRREYAVVRNDEERYSVWPADREPPAGWYRTGFAGRKSACLEHIDAVWTDMRPKSLRERMAATQGATS